MFVFMARKSLTSLVKLVEDVSTEAPVEKAFVADLNYSIEKSAGKDKHTPSRTFKPSSIGGCAKCIAYQLIGEEPHGEKGLSASTVGILENGTDRHIRLQEAICDMKNNGIDCEYVDVADFVKQEELDYIKIVAKSGIETKCFWEEIPLSFLTDGIIKYKGKYYILEIKTMNADKFFKSKDVREEHKAQGICYSLAFGISDVIYLYECRDSLSRKAFRFHVTDSMRKDLMEKVNYIKDTIASGELPHAEKGVKCKYCPYSYLCE